MVYILHNFIHVHHTFIVYKPIPLSLSLFFPFLRLLIQLDELGEVPPQAATTAAKRVHILHPLLVCRLRGRSCLSLV